MRLLLPLFVLLILTACASVEVSPMASPERQAADQLLRDGKYHEAALAYTALAANGHGTARDIAQVRAADAWERDDEMVSARQALALANRRRLGGEDALLYDLLSAEFLLADQRGREALPLLDQSIDSVPVADRVRWHSLRARVFAANGLGFEEAGEDAQLMQGLSSRERSAMARTIARLLAAVTPSELSQKAAALPVGHPLYGFAGRELLRRGLPMPRPFDRDPTLAQTGAFPAAEADGYRPPRQLAVLLPMSGELASAGQSVRDGFLAGYYAESRRRPTIRFYDTGSTADSARQAATQAVQDGAQLLVGPLTRDGVTAVLDQADLGVPVLALNRGQNQTSSGSSFALAPEDEGIAVADRLAARGLLRVIAIGQNDDNAKRALASFREQLRSRGGEIVAEFTASDGSADAANALANATAQANGQAQAVFLALKAPQARLLAAQLKTSPLASLPRLSTSLILAGGGNARLDSELDGIEYPELPWLLGQRPGLPGADGLSSARGPAQRLFAFGLDAWQLSAYLDKLGNDPAAMVHGATGELRLDAVGGVQRDPAWAVFSGGRARAAN